MRNIAVAAAVTCFFVMVIIGSITGLSTATCCYRSVTGAVVTYLVASFAGRLVVSIIISAFVQNKLRNNRKNTENTGVYDAADR